MLLVRLEQVDALAVAEPAVDQLDLAERVPAPLDVEEVAGADREQGRLGSAQGDVIGVIHAGGDLAGDVLLGVLRADRGEEPLERGDVARRRRHGDPVVEGHQVGGHRAAARVAGAAQAVGIDLGPARQVVERRRPSQIR